MIIICEPQCIGFEHVEFNAALITIFSCAFPNEKILFLAEAKHTKQLKKKLRSQSIKGVKFLTIDLPSRNISSFRKLPEEFKLCRKVFELAIKNKTNRVIFSSITSPCLISIKILLRKFKELKCVIIPHRILETLIERPSLRQPCEIPFWFRLWFPIGNINRLNYLVLGPSIEQQLSILFPNVKKFIKSIHHPYFYKEPDEFLPFYNKKIGFGSFGVGHRGKGTDLFFRMAIEIKTKETEHKPEFILIGHITDKAIKHLISDSVYLPSPDTPLSREEFDQYAKDIDYAVFLQNPKTYRLVASGALFDAFSYIKPIIALRNPFFEYYFEIMGDIGYLCDSYDEMKEIIVNILEKGLTERYVRQKENILKGRQQLSISKLGYTISSIWNENEIF